MRTYYWIIGTLLLTSALMAWQMPASWALQRLIGPQTDIVFKGVDGRIWSGKARQVDVFWQGERYSLGEVEWLWRPQTLLRLQACIDFVSRLNTQVLEGTACRHAGGDWSLYKSEIHVPASLAQLFLPIQVQGELPIYVEQITLSQGRVTELDARSQRRQAAYHNSQTWLSLGHLAGTFSSNHKGTITADIVDIEGPMAVNLLLQSPYQQSTYLAGKVQLKSDAPQALGQLLQALGFPRQGDDFDIAWNF